MSSDGVEGGKFISIKCLSSKIKCCVSNTNRLYLKFEKTHVEYGILLIWSARSVHI